MSHIYLQNQLVKKKYVARYCVNEPAGWGCESSFAKVPDFIWANTLAGEVLLLLFELVTEIGSGGTGGSEKLLEAIGPTLGLNPVNSVVLLTVSRRCIAKVVLTWLYRHLVRTKVTTALKRGRCKTTKWYSRRLWQQRLVDHPSGLL